MKVKCPQCGERVEYSTANPYRPFCSERCKTVDLGAWASDRYAIPGEPLESDDRYMRNQADPDTADPAGH